MEELGAGRRTIQDALTALQAKGYISIHLTGPGNREREITTLITTSDSGELCENPHGAEKCTVRKNSTNYAKIRTKRNNKETSILVPTPYGARNGESKKRKVFSSDSNAYKLAAFLADSIAERTDTERVSENRVQSWALDFDRCNRIDKRPWSEIENVLCWSQENTFWQDNILSGSKFRKQYVQLLSKMKKEADSERL